MSSKNNGDFFGGVVFMFIAAMVVAFIIIIADWTGEIDAHEYVMLKGLVAEFPEELTPMYTKMLDQSVIIGAERDDFIHKWKQLRKQRYAAEELALGVTSDD